MALPQFSLKDLLEAGVHFGHKAHRWNPEMEEYLYGVRNGIHIIDLRQTVPMLYRAISFARHTVAGGGRILFVGSKRQAQSIVAQAAERSGQYYVNHRWLGGMLTNWKTINKSIKRLKELEALFAKEGESHLTKKELLQLRREYEKLTLSLGGIKDMGGLPDAIFVIDTGHQHIAVKEANNLGIPVIGVVDSNCSPAGVDYPIPGNDDSTRALNLYCSLISDAILDGISEQLSRAGNTHKKGDATVRRSSSAVVNLSPKAAEAADKAEEDAVETLKADSKDAEAAAAKAAVAN